MTVGRLIWLSVASFVTLSIPPLGRINNSSTRKKQVVKRSWGSSAGKRSVNFSETDEHTPSRDTLC